MRTVRSGHAPCVCIMSVESTCESFWSRLLSVLLFRCESNDRVVTDTLLAGYVLKRSGAYAECLFRALSEVDHEILIRICDEFLL